MRLEKANMLDKCAVFLARRLSSRKFGYVFTTLVAMGLCGPQPTRADFFLHSWENQQVPTDAYQLLPKLGVFQSSSNFDEDGSAQDPTGLNHYRRLMVELNAQASLGPGWTLFGRVQWVRVGVDISTGTDSNAFGFADQTIGINTSVYHSKALQFNLQLQGDIPTYSNTDNEAESRPILGDGSIDVTAGGFATIPLKMTKTSKLEFTGGVGYTFRTEDYSPAIPWSLSLKMKRSRKGVQFAASALGHISTGSDKNITVGGIPTRSVSSTGGSYFSNSSNASYLALQGQIGFRFDRQKALLFDFQNSMWGKNAPKGWAAWAGVEIRLGSRFAGREGPKVEDQPSNEGFVQYSGKIQAQVTRVSDRFHIVKIDKGKNDGVRVGQILDIFRVNPEGAIVDAIARGQVQSVKAGEAAVKIVEYYKEVWIEPGFRAQSPSQ